MNIIQSVPSVICRPIISLGLNYSIDEPAIAGALDFEDDKANQIKLRSN